MMLPSRLHHVATGRYPARTVGIVRIAIGIVAIVRGLETARIIRRILSSDIINVPWAAWLPGASSGTAAVVVALWLCSAVAFTVGVRTQTAGLVLTISMVASMALDSQLYASHFYLLILIVGLLTFASPGTELSMHARNDGLAMVRTVPSWPIFLIKVQISVVYLFGSITKVNNTFLSGGVLQRTLGSGLLPAPEFMLNGVIVRVLAVLVVATELWLAITLWRSARRRFALVVGGAFHLSIPLLIGPLVDLLVFSGEMLACYVLFTASTIGSAEAVPEQRPQVELVALRA